jgi:hypothetical protein
MASSNPRPFLVIAREIDKALLRLTELKAEAALAVQQLPVADPPAPPPVHRKRRFKHTPETRQKLKEAWSRRKNQKAQLVELADRLPS